MIITVPDPERRRHRRTSASERAALQVLNPLSLEWRDVTILNISDSGMCILSPVFLSVGVEMRVRRDGPASVFGKVAYCMPSGNAFRIGLDLDEPINWHRRHVPLTRQEDEEKKTEVPPTPAR